MLSNRFDGTLLKVLRNKANLSYFDLATEAKLHGFPLKPWTIERHEKGGSQPSGSALVFYCSYFKVAISEFYSPKKNTEVANAKKKTKQAKNKTGGARGSKIKQRRS